MVTSICKKNVLEQFSLASKPANSFQIQFGSLWAQLINGSLNNWFVVLSNSEFLVAFQVRCFTLTDCTGSKADVISGSLFVQFLLHRSSLYFSQRFTWLKSTGGHFLFWTALDGLQSAILSTWIVYSFMMIKNKKGKKQKRTETKEQKRNEMAKRTAVAVGWLSQWQVALVRLDLSRWVDISRFKSKF